MEEELNKPTWRPKFKSEFSMGEYDFKRFDFWLNEADKSSAYINSTNLPSIELIQNYFSQLNILYKSWRALISSKEIKEELDTAIKKAKVLKRIWENSILMGMPQDNRFVLGLTDLLDEVHTKLLDIKQVIGLGIVVRKSLTLKEKIKLGIHGDKDFRNLPEA